MQKFIVGINGRTGSTIYALWLDTAVPRSLDETSSYISWNNRSQIGELNTPDWSLPIQHTHQPEVFATAPAEFKRLWCRRNYFDSTLSHAIAEHTNKYHLWSQKDLAEYQTKYQNTNFVVDPIWFESALRAAHSRDSDVSQWQKQSHSDMISLLYHVHAQNTQAFYNAVNVTIPKFAPAWPQPMPINKYDLVENLSQLLDVYCKFDSAFDVDKDATVARITQYLQK
jgi:hypothetical protein